MNAAGLTYGDANEVAEWLMSTNMPDIMHADLVAVMANAMRRIAHLERQVAEQGCSIWAATSTAQGAANIASCLANGIRPD